MGINYQYYNFFGFDCILILVSFISIVGFKFYNIQNYKNLKFLIKIKIYDRIPVMKYITIQINFYTKTKFQFTEKT